jgi:hypothetical protein
VPWSPGRPPSIDPYSVLHRFRGSGSGLLWDPFAFLTRLGEAYGNGLFAALDLATFAARPTFRGAAFIAVHFALYVLAGAGGVFALCLFCHRLFPPEGTEAAKKTIGMAPRPSRYFSRANRPKARRG